MWLSPKRTPEIRYHRPLPDSIKVDHLQEGVRLVCHNRCSEVPDPVEVPVETTLGVDVGLNSFVVDSDGERIPNPRHFRKVEKKLGKHQRILSRRKKGSKRRAKQREVVARSHEPRISARISSLRRRIALLNVDDEVAVEDLKIKNMLKPSPRPYPTQGGAVFG